MDKIKILFLAANPAGTRMLQLDEEIRSISEKIRASELRDSFELNSAWAVRPDDLLQLLNMHKPHIVHFSGHGSQAGEILLTDNYGKAKPVSALVLKALFTSLKDNIRVVLLNACYSRTQAESIREVIDYVIGMNTEIGDTAAVLFAASFYRALGFDRSVQDAFGQGLLAVQLEGLREENTPEFLMREGADPNGKLLTLVDTQTPDLREIVERAEALLRADNPDGAYELLKTISPDSEWGGKANLLSAFSLMSGRSFNRMSQAERNKLEQHLNTARKKMNGAILPLVCLALLELDYYNYHGQASANNISVIEVAQKVKLEKISEADAGWLGMMVISSDAKRSLGLSF